MRGHPDRKALVTIGLADMFREALQGRGNLGRDDLEYVVTTVHKLKDERLRQCIAELIGWGDEERSKLETAAAIALELIKLSSPKKLAEAARRVELGYHIRALKSNK